MNRVIAYVDGFNLYYGIKSMGWKRYYWLDIQALIRSLLKPGQQLVSTKYFTSRVSSTPADPHKAKRQGTYLEALGTLPDFRITYGHYLAKPVRCRKCGAVWNSHEEKMTDVNMAVEMITDAYGNRFDTAVLVSADSDLIAPVRTVRGLIPARQIMIWFPPNRHSTELAQAANAAYMIGRRKLAESQFPDEVAKPDGYVLRRPAQWG